MTVQMLQERPPFVRFDTISVEDRDATIKQGSYVGKDIDMAFITPAGSKDCIERVVSEWFDKLTEDLASSRIPAAWVEHYKTLYRAFKEGKAPPVSGTPVIDWPGLSPSVVKTLISLNLRAIEDVAVLNEEGIARLGMGGRALRQRAIDYLAAAKNVGQVAEEMSAMRARTEAAEARNEANDEKIRVMAAQLAALTQNGGQSNGMDQRSHSTGITAADILDDGPGDPL